MSATFLTYFELGASWRGPHGAGGLRRVGPWTELRDTGYVVITRQACLADCPRAVQCAANSARSPRECARGSREPFGMRSTTRESRPVHTARTWSPDPAPEAASRT